MQGIVNALALAQSYDRRHPDISPMYVVESREQWKISFNATTQQTPNYKAPQDVVQEESNPYKAGVFSLGLVFLEMASLNSIENLNLPNQLNNIYERVCALEYGKVIKAIILFMLKHDQMARPDFLSLDENILYDGFSLKNYKLVNEAYMYDEFHFTAPEISEEIDESVEKSMDQTAEQSAEVVDMGPHVVSQVKYTQVTLPMNIQIVSGRRGKGRAL